MQFLGVGYSLEYSAVVSGKSQNNDSITCPLQADCIGNFMFNRYWDFKPSLNESVLLCECAILMKMTLLYFLSVFFFYIFARFLQYW